MDFGHYLFQTGRLTKVEYGLVVNTQFNRIASSLNAKGFISVPLQDMADPATAQFTPFGIVMDQVGGELWKLVCERAGKTKDELVLEWHTWHLKNSQPLSNYGSVNLSGRNLFERTVEKKAVAHFVSTAAIRRGVSLVLDGDIVVVPEGSSSFYCAMGIAATHKDISFVTSNGPFIREYHENTAVRKSAKSFRVVGGEANSLHCYGGFQGPDTARYFHSVFTEHPSVTVLICSCTGLLPDTGPFGPEGNAVGTRASILKDALEGGVREVIFIADGTKHLESHRERYGLPLFPDGEWTRLLEKYCDRITVVTCPPAELRKYNTDAWTIDTFGTTDPELKTRPVREYCLSAKRFMTHHRSQAYGYNEPLFFEATAHALPGGVS